MDLFLEVYPSNVLYVKMCNFIVQHWVGEEIVMHGPLTLSFHDVIF